MEASKAAGASNAVADVSTDDGPIQTPHTHAILNALDARSEALQAIASSFAGDARTGNESRLLETNVRSVLDHYTPTMEADTDSERLIAAVGNPALRSMIAIALDSRASIDKRSSALSVIGQIGSAEATAFLASVITSDQFPKQLRTDAVSSFPDPNKDPRCVNDRTFSSITTFALDPCSDQGLVEDILSSRSFECFFDKTDLLPLCIQPDVSGEVKSAALLIIGASHLERSDLGTVESILQNPDEDDDVRVASAVILGRSDNPRALQVLRDVAYNEETPDFVRLGCAQGVLLMNSEPLTKELRVESQRFFEQLPKSFPDLESSGELGLHLANLREAFPTLVARASDTNVALSKRNAAAEAARGLANEGNFRQLEPLLSSDDLSPSTCAALSTAYLRLAGGSRSEIIGNLIEHPQSLIPSLSIVSAVKDLRLKQYEPDLMRLAAERSNDPTLRQSACNALAVIGGAQSISQLTEILEHDELPEMRCAAVGALREISDHSPERSKEIGDILYSAYEREKGSAVVRNALKDALGHLGDPCIADDLARDLVPFHAAKDHAKRVSAILALARMQDPRSVPQASELINDTNSLTSVYERVEAVDALASVGSLGTQALQASLESPYEPVRLRAASCLLRLGVGDEQARSIVQSFVDSTNESLSKEAMSTLLRYPAASSTRLIMNLISNRDESALVPRSRLDQVISDPSLLENFAHGLEQLAAAPGEGEHARELMDYAASLRRCPELGLSHPLRFFPEDLPAITANRTMTKHQRGEKVAVVILPRDDHNGAFFSMAEGFHDLLTTQQTYFYEASSDAEALGECTAHGNKGRFPKAHTLVIGGHGSKYSLALQEGVDENSLGYDRSVISVEDEAKIRESGASTCLRKGGAVVLISCSTGSGSNTPGESNNLVNAIRRDFPQAASGMVMGPSDEAGFHSFIFDRNGDLTAAEFSVPTYRAK